MGADRRRICSKLHAHEAYLVALGPCGQHVDTPHLAELAAQGAQTPRLEHDIKHGAQLAAIADIAPEAGAALHEDGQVIAGVEVFALPVELVGDERLVDTRSVSIEGFDDVT